MKKIESIFAPIDQFGDHSLQTERKAQIVTDVAAVLTDLGVNAELVLSVAQATEPLLPLLSLVFNRLPTDDEQIKREGRGVYHEDIPIGNRGSTVYVKGIGNDTLIGEATPEGLIPGFPTTTEKIMFDSMFSFSDHPRILGTETLRWGLLEFINSCVVFSELARDAGWTNIEQAIDAGVTIPIGLTHFPELTAKMTALIEERKKETSVEYEKEFLSWQGNFEGLGAVGQITPSSVRHTRIPNPKREDIPTVVEKYGQLTEISQWGTAGRTLNLLLKKGILYSYESSHGQNLYRSIQEKRIHCAQADNSGLVFLGDYQDQDVDDRYTGLVHFSSVEQRETLLFQDLNRYDGLTPLAYPEPEFGVTMAQVVECQKEFLSSFLEGVVHPDALAQLPWLMPALRTQINLAISKLMIEAHESPSWDALAKKRKALVGTYDKVGALSELKAKISNNLEPRVVLEHRDFIQESNPFGINAIVQFLKTGDREIIIQDEHIGPYVLLSSMIVSIEDSITRDRLLNALAQMQNSRDLLDVLKKDERNLDLIDLFNNKPLELIIEHITNGDYESALKVMRLIDEIGSWRKSLHHPTRKYDYVLYAFGLDLVQNVNVDDLTEQLELITVLSSLGSRTSNGLIYSFIVGSSKLDIFEWTYQRQVSTPKNILFGTLGQYIEHPKERKQIVAIFTEYERRLLQLEMISPSDNAQDALVSDLDAFVATYGNEYPEFEMVHNFIMANYLQESDFALAKTYFQKGVKYYDEHYEQRKNTFSSNHDLVKKDNAQYWKKHKEEMPHLGQKYAALGYQKISNAYRAEI